MKQQLRVSVILCAALSWTSSSASAELLFGYVNSGSGQYIVSFDSSTPGTLNPIVPLTGLPAGRFFDGIDFRPSNGLLYGYAHTGGVTGNLAQINVTTGAVTFVGGSSTEPNGGFRGFDFNPVVDLIRIATNSENNLRYNPNDGSLVATDSALAYAAGDPNFGANPTIVHVAYSNNVTGAATTTLYGIDSNLDILVLIGGLNGAPSPNTGQLSTVGALGVNTIIGSGGFDISGLSGVAYAALDIGSGSSLYTINLSTGAATLVGAIGDGSTVFNGLSVQPAVSVPQSIAIPTLAEWALIMLAMLLLVTGWLGYRRRQ